MLVFMKPFMAYLEAACVSGVCCDMAFGTDDDKTLSGFPVIVLPYVWQKGETTPCDRSYLPEMRAGDGALLKLLIGGGFTECSREDVLVSMFETPGGTVLHFVNTEGFLPALDGETSPFLPVPPFEAGAEKLDLIRATVPFQNRAGGRAKLHSPEFEGEKTASVRWANGKLTVEIPADTFSGYLLAVLETGGTQDPGKD